jgi:spore germination protein KC
MSYVDSAVFEKNADGTYTIVVAIMNPHGMGGAGSMGAGGGNKNPYITFMGTGPSLREAITDQSVSREMADFGAHNKANFLSESFAQGKGNMMSLLDFTSRERLSDEKPLLIVIKGDHPEKIYDSMIGISGMVGEYVVNMSKSQPKDMAKGVFTTVLEFIRDYYTEGKEPVAGLITIIESRDKASNNTNIGESSGSNSDGQQSSSIKYQIRYQGVAAFRDGRLVGFMDGNEAQAYNFLINKIKSAIITVPVGEPGTTVLHITKSNTSIKSNVLGKKAVIDVKVKAAAVVSVEGYEIDVTKPDGLKEIQDGFNKEIEQQILKVIKKAQAEFKSDIFGFGEFLHIQHPDIWKTVKGSWNDEYFSNAAVSVTVKSDIVMTGKIEKPISMEGTQ